MKKFLLLLGLGMCLINTTVTAQKEVYQGIFIYQFTKYVKWPAQMDQDKFCIGVVGDEQAMHSLEKMANTKKQTQGKEIVIRKIQDPGAVEGVHILYVQDSHSHLFSQIRQAAADQPVLLVTEKAGLGDEGSMINFVEVKGKLRFELNQSEVESHGLKVSSTLASLAIPR